MWGEIEERLWGKGEWSLLIKKVATMECPKCSVLGCNYSDTFGRVERSHQTLIPWIHYGKA